MIPVLAEDKAERHRPARLGGCGGWPGPGGSGEGRTGRAGAGSGLGGKAGPVLPQRGRSSGTGFILEDSVFLFP